MSNVRSAELVGVAQPIARCGEVGGDIARPVLQIDSEIRARDGFREGLNPSYGLSFVTPDIKNSAALIL